MKKMYILVSLFIVIFCTKWNKDSSYFSSKLSIQSDTLINKIPLINRSVNLNCFNEFMRINSIKDPYFTYQWGMKNIGMFVDKSTKKSIANIDINIVNAWDKYKGKKEVLVAVIDTGIDYTHEDLKEIMWINKDEVPDDGIDNDNNGYVDDVYGWNFANNTSETYSHHPIDNHGTHIAGIIAAKRNGVGIVGVASNTNIKIMTLKVLDTNSKSGSIDSFVRAIEYAEEMGASICNISAGTYVENIKFKSAIENSKMLFVVAAGNDEENNDVCPLYPASFGLDNIVSVANLKCDGTLNSSSNYGAISVDIAAPGTSIMSTAISSRYGYLSGTSMAAPYVSGIIAMVYSYYEDITLLEAKEIVLSTVYKLPQLKDKV